MLDRWLIGTGLGIALLGGCGEPTAPKERLVTHVTIDRVTLAPGDTVRATVIVTNVSLSSVTIRGSSTCLIELAVYREATGELVYPRDQLCTTDLKPLRFAPGQSHSRIHIWTAERYEYVSPDWRKHPEPPGLYRIVGGLHYGVVTAPSTPVRIEVVAP